MTKHVGITPNAIVTLVLLLVSGCCRSSAIRLDVPLVAQHRDEWCWAATTEMISTYYGHPVSQCKSANFVHNTPPDCCTGCTGKCPGWGWHWGAYVEDIEKNWGYWRFQYTYVASILTWDELRTIISSARSPIQAWLWVTNGGAHVVTVYGYDQIGAVGYVLYLDPLPEDCTRNDRGQCTPREGGGDYVLKPYADFVSDPAYDWGVSFHSFKYVGDQVML